MSDGSSHTSGEGGASSGGAEPPLLAGERSEPSSHLGYGAEDGRPGPQDGAELAGPKAPPSSHCSYYVSAGSGGERSEPPTGAQAPGSGVVPALAPRAGEARAEGADTSEPLLPFGDGFDLIGAIEPPSEEIEPGEIPDDLEDLPDAAPWEGSEPQDVRGLQRGDQIQVGDYVGPLVQGVNPDNFYGAEKISHRMKYVASLAAMGLRNIDIARMSGYSPVRVGQLLSTPIVSVEVERQRQALLKTDPDLSLRTMMPKALEVIRDTLEDAKEKKSLRVDTAFRLMERTHGKPKQSIDVGGNLLKDLFDLLDKRDREVETTGRPVEASQDAEIVKDEPEASPDPLDAFVERNFPGEASQGGKKA